MNQGKLSTSRKKIERWEQVGKNCPFVCFGAVEGGEKTETANGPGGKTTLKVLGDTIRKRKKTKKKKNSPEFQM